MKQKQSQLKQIAQFIRYAVKRKRSGDDYFEFQRFQGRLIIECISKYKRLQQPLVILDIGSGIGGYVYEFAKLKNIYMVSLDKNPLDIAIKRYKAISPLTKNKKLNLLLKKNAKKILESKKIAVIQGDITDAPFKNEVFDVIIASGVIEHVPNQEAMLQECHRILKKDGLFYLSFPPYYSPTGGHSISPLHYLPGKIPLWLYKKMHTKKHESFIYYGLYKTTLSSVKKMLKGKFRVMDIRPRLFSMLKPLLQIPFINEIISHHIEFILKKE